VLRREWTTFCRRDARVSYPEKTPTRGVSRLEDRDGDGRFDTRTVFLGGLSWPTGIFPYDDGAFIAVESANAITLKRAEGASDSVARDQIATIAATGVSLMPEGLEKDLSNQDVANVISFVRSIQAPSKSQPPLPRRSDRAWSMTLARKER
jgi:hypothetical protein